MSPAGPATTTKPTWSVAHLVLLDIDAHLTTTSHRVTAETVGALELARSAGHTVMLSTERPLTGLLRLARQLGVDEGYAICSHGALTVRLDPTMPSGYEVINAATFDLGTLIQELEDLQFLSQTLIAVENDGIGWRVNSRFENGLHGAQEEVALTQLRGETTTLARLHAPGIIDGTDMLAAGTGLTVTPTGTDSCDVTGPGISLSASSDVARNRPGLPACPDLSIHDSLRDSVSALLPPDALRHELSALAAQLTAAVTTAATAVEAEPEMTVRVWFGDDVLARVELWIRRRHGWVRHAPIPAGRGATMRAVEHAALDAGLSFPRGTEGRRRPWWRSAADSGTPAGFELPLGPT